MTSFPKLGEIETDKAKLRGGGFDIGYLDQPQPNPHPPRRCEKVDLVFFTSFRRKPESSVFRALRTDWTPVFTGVTAEIQFFHTFPPPRGRACPGE